MCEGTRLLTRSCSRNTQVTPATTTIPAPQVCICGDVWMTRFISFTSQADPVTPESEVTRPAAGSSPTSDPSVASLDSADLSLAARSPNVPASPAPAPVSAPATASCPALEPVLTRESPTPAPTTLTDSEESLGAQNDTPLAQTTTAPSDDPPSRVFEHLAIAVYSEPAAGPSTTALGDLDPQINSQLAQSIPSTSGASKKAKRPAAKKKTPKGKRVTAK